MWLHELQQTCIELDKGPIVTAIEQVGVAVESFDLINLELELSPGLSLGLVVAVSK